MLIIQSGTEILSPIQGMDILKTIEVAGRTCYKSENAITNDSAIQFCKNLIKRGHEAMLEHASLSVRFTCDRGVSHEIVRHRIASYAQESTRYCNYAKEKFGNEITVIDITEAMQLECGKMVKHPLTGQDFVITPTVVKDWIAVWYEAMQYAEGAYLKLIQNCCPAQLARSVLNNSLKTEIVVTMNIREWRHFLSLRADTPAHPQMREITIPLLKTFKSIIPVLFDDIWEVF